MKSKDFRRMARENLAGRWGNVAVMTLLYMLIYGAINVATSFISKVNSYMSDVVSFVVFIISPVIGYGFIKALILFRRKEEVGVFDFLKLGFEDFKKVWYVNVLLLFKYIGPFFLIGIAAAGLLFCIILVIGCVFGPPMEVIGQISSMIENIIRYSAFFVFLAIIWLIPIAYKYCFAFFELVYNPNVSSREIIRTTGKYMKGNRWKLFKLMFTFLGWAFLTVIFLGIPIFWFIPYATIAGIFFYEKVSGRLEEREEINQGNQQNPVQYETDVPKDDSKYL